eukprot:scaffold467_cov403-Prasinococcus_capsulatus_cf.AAC.21
MSLRTIFPSPSAPCAARGDARARAAAALRRRASRHHSPVAAAAAAAAAIRRQARARAALALRKLRPGQRQGDDGRGGRARTGRRR